MGIRDTGFGLNYNQGFGKGSFIPAAAPDSASMQSAWNLLGQGRQREYEGQQASQQRGLQQYLGDQSNAAQRYAADQQAATARQGNRLQYSLGMDQMRAQTGKFNTVFNLMKDQLGNFGGGMGAGGYGGAGAVGSQPNISDQPVFTPQQVQQQVNAARSGNDQAAAGAQQRMQQGLAGRGFGAGSPLAAALGQNLYAQNLATNTGNERDTRMGAAQTNAGQVFEAQKAREQQYANRQQEEIERGKTYTGFLGSILGSFGSLI